MAVWANLTGRDEPCFKAITETFSWHKILRRQLTRISPSARGIRCPTGRNMENRPSQTRSYFIDEGGDSTLFSRKGKVLIASEGCSRFFVLGLLDVPDPSALKSSISNLRARLMRDPYFSNVPSMQAKARKTALAFHAKDDLPEVRREVFGLLRAQGELRFFAVVADKWHVLEYVRQRNESDPGYRYHPNELYDYMIRRFFKERLHKSRQFRIFFSKRGKADRTAALRKALTTTQERFAEQHGLTSNAPLQVFEAPAKEQAGLQAVDYFVWALQRLYERQDEQYVTYLWRAFRFVQDVDDRRRAEYGMYYTQQTPLNAASLEWRQGKKEPGI